VTVVGLILYASAKSDLSEAEDKCPNRKCDVAINPGAASDGNAARKRVTLGGTLTVSGILVAGGGLVWYFLSPKSGADGAVSAAQGFSPVAAPSFVGLSYSGIF
jgi:hypothetical protein